MSTSTKELLKKGWVRTIITFEVVGKPAKHVEQSLAKYLANLKKDDRIKVLQEESDEVAELEDGMFSTIAELEILVQNLETLTWLAINFSPASIEVLEPEELRIEGRDLTNWYNDLLSKLHEISHDYRNVKSGNEHMTAAVNTLIQNSILLAIDAGHTSPKAIASATGVLEAQLSPFLTHLIEKKRITKKGSTYTRS
jgi:thiamine phosphate synthase YjbQ (UPF0047 family)